MASRHPRNSSSLTKMRRHRRLAAGAASATNFLARLGHSKIFEDVTPSPHPYVVIGNHLFRGVHIELSLHTNFQLDSSILKCLYDVIDHPSFNPLFIPGDLHFCNRHTEISLPANFQPDPS